MTEIFSVRNKLCDECTMRSKPYVILSEAENVLKEKTNLHGRFDFGKLQIREKAEIVRQLTIVNVK